MMAADCDCRLIIVSNHLPLRVKRGATGWEFEWDEDALVGQAKVREQPCQAKWRLAFVNRSQSPRRRESQESWKFYTSAHYPLTWLWRSRM